MSKVLPIVVADDDFIEHLHEMSYYNTIDIGELNEEWNTWSSENCE